VRRTLFLAACLESSLIAQQDLEALSPRALRATAGESRTAVWRDGTPLMTAITFTRITPPLEFPILVEMTSAPRPSGLKFVIPPATPPGEYAIEVAGRRPDGRSASIVLQLSVESVTLSPAAVTARPPVILLNGFQPICTDSASTLAASVDTFGQLASLLQADGVAVGYFNNCSYGDISIEQLAGQLNIYLAGLQYTDGTPVSQVDLVAHSMGGLIARSYLAGKGGVSGVFSPPANTKVRKLTMIATPHFGSFQAAYVGTQESEMALGNQFLLDLATWNQGQDDLRGVDAVAIIGNAGTYGNTASASDGVVSLTSGSLGFAEPDQRTRIVPYCHITPGFLTGLGMSCSGHQGIADINTPSHLTAQIVRSFLSDTLAWQSLGTAPSQDPFLKADGGTLLALKGSNDVYFRDITSVQFDSGAGALTGGPSSAIASIFYAEYIGTGSHSFVMNHSTGQPTAGTGVISAGGSSAVLFKFGPLITSVQSTISTGLSGLTVASGSTIVLSGVGFGTTTATQLSANGSPLTSSQISDKQITAFLPSSYSGLVRFTVSNANGQHSVNVMTVPTTLPPSISLSRTQLQFSYVVGGTSPAPQVITVTNAAGGVLSWTTSTSASWLSASASGPSLTVSVNPVSLSPTTYTGNITVTASGASNSPQTIMVTLTVGVATPVVVVSSVTNSASGASGAVAPGEIVTIKGSGLGPTTGVSFSVDPNTGTVVSTLAGTRVLFGSFAAPITYTSATQINALVPYEVAGQSQIVMQVQYQGSVSVPTSLQVGTAAPGVFTFNATGTGQAVAANQDGSFNGISGPAAKGSYVTIYFTGGGQTNPIGATGSVNGSVLKYLTQHVSVTVGGEPAAVAFAGAAPTLVDGVLQLNIQLSGNTPSGNAQPLAISVGGVASPTTATLAVQ
jgi:uncharacterized protein (TIGR03437 family)